MSALPQDRSVQDSMDEFIDWDASAAAATQSLASAAAPIFPDQAFDVEHLLVSPQLQQMNDHDASLLFENPDADDFSFWALEHYEQSNMFPDVVTDAANDATTLTPDAPTVTGSGAVVFDALPPSTDPAALSLGQDSVLESFGLLGVPGEPCTHCQSGGYQCKKIQEGSYKGYCTSCVALRCECSFGLASAGPVPTAVSFPPNPWPTLGDHPDPIRHDEEHMDAVNQLDAGPVLASATALLDPAGRASPMPLAANQPKLGARFSRESVRILKNWVSTHSRHPYPTEEEKESLQRLTGLNKTQIANWLANARRRGKIPTTRSTSPHVRNTYSGPSAPVDIPQPRRSGTPSPFERRVCDNIPLQRWANSPPENEPASVTDIARAITSSASAISSGLNSPLSLNFTDDGSGRSLFNGSSASSAGTSLSSGAGSFASAYSHVSRGSLGSNFSSLGRGRRRRRRHSAPLYKVGSAGGDDREDSAAEKKRAGRSSKHVASQKPSATPLVSPLKTYQCTFCTETFKTKHDWQRHEKSLHLSLERWICTPQGAVAIHPETKQPHCVFCDHVNPDDAHIESHNYSSCQERALTDRTFYRKDHLRQHLRLVHGVKFVPWSMEQWKVITPEIRSRCGFCGIAMDTWTFRIDHLADHFKTGRTMADWKGDWGFDRPVLEMVENSIPPYLIHDERNSPLPFCATSQSPASPRNAFELVKGELAYWLQHTQQRAELVTDKDMRREACRIVFAADVVVASSLESHSWFRDLLLADAECTRAARLGPIRSQSESSMAKMHINGKESVFDACPLEAALRDFVRVRSQLGLTPLDSELQTMACDIVQKMEIELIESSGEGAGAETPVDKTIADFWLRLIKSSTSWLAAFRKRAHLPHSDAIADESRRPVDDPNNIDATIYNYRRLETELAEFVRVQREAGCATPDNTSLQRQARLIIYELDDGWNQTAADDPQWLAEFRSKHIDKRVESHQDVAGLSRSTARNPHNPNFLVPSKFFLNDTTCYRRLAQELTRFTTMVMSPNNPNCHVPSDEELQHQARWILFDDDDPWNQTAADNAEWLLRFKRDVGILPPADGPGLPVDNLSWSIAQGGSGFAPPYCFPKSPLAPIASPDEGHGEAESGSLHDTSMSCQLNTSVMHGIQFETSPSTTNNYLHSFTTRYTKPATVFCSRELENELANYVRTAILHGQPFPDDDSLRFKAREILGCTSQQATPADNDELLGKFKDMVHSNMSGEIAATTQLPTIPDDLDMDFAGGTALNMDSIDMNFDTVAQEDMDNILKNIDFQVPSRGT